MKTFNKKELLKWFEEKIDDEMCTLEGVEVTLQRYEDELKTFIKTGKMSERSAKQFVSEKLLNGEL